MTDSLPKPPASCPPEASCPACGSTDISQTDRVWDHEYAVNWAPDYARCKQCGSCYQTPMPSLEALAKAYPADYHSMGRSGLLVDIRYSLRLRRLRVWLDSDSKQVNSQPGAFLDFGCGDGSFLEYAARRGGPSAAARQWFGYEIGESRQVETRQDGRVTIVRGSVSDLMEILPSCGLITLNHVIEHLPDPRGTLSLLRGALLPGGVLEGQTPAAGSLEHQVFDRRWSGYHAPRHTVIFSKAGLARVLERAGFYRISIRGAFNPAGIAVSLASLTHPVAEAAQIRRQGVGWLMWLSLAGMLGPIDLLSGRPGVVDFAAYRPTHD